MTHEAQVGNFSTPFEAGVEYIEAIDALTKPQLRDALLAEYEARRAYQNLCHAIHDESADWVRDYVDVPEYLPEPE